MPPPTPLLCSVTLCDYETPAGTPTWDLMRDMLQIHASSAHPTAPAVGGAAPPAVRPKPAPVSRPEIDLAATEADWRFFMDEFARYKRSTGVDGQTVLDELWHCQSKALRTLMQAEGTQELTTEDLLLARIKSLAVVTMHSAVHLVQLRNLQQGQAEPIRKFVARARNLASSCNLSKKCSGCQLDVSFLDETVFGVVLAGLRDNNIQQKILSLAAMKTIQKLEDLVTYVAAEESGYKELANIGQNTLGAVKSTYTREKNAATKTACMNCGGHKHGDGGPEDRAKSCPAFGKTCGKCQKKNHTDAVCRSKSKVAIVRQEPTQDINSGINASLSFFGIKVSEDPPTKFAPATDTETVTNLRQLASISGNITKHGGVSPTTIPLPHSIHSVIHGWLQSKPTHSPSHQVELSVDKSSYAELGLSLPKPSMRNKPSPRMITNGVMDTGAQLNMTSEDTVNKLGYRGAALFPVNTNVASASNIKIHILGGIILKVTATNTTTGVTLSCKQLFYVSNQVSETYLSRDCCLQLQTIPPDFPSIGSCPPDMGLVAASNVVPSLAPCSNSGIPSTSDTPCTCPRRTLPPSAPATLPCPATEENLPILKQFILDRYASSAFNCCEHQPLPLMKGSEPLRLFVDPKATPRAIHTPAQVPLHWKQSVKDGLDRDERLGVIEKVKENTPTKWCSRMVITAKHDGSPRRVVDYQPVNDHAPRQTHHTETPWAIASSVPANKVKTVLDAYHGYHSVEIDPADRDLTVFLTEYGRYQYRTCPQGFISSGDGYSIRMDKIIGNNFKDYKKCVDDSIIWDSDISANFHRVCKFLDMCSNQGVLFNPKKFQFGEKTVRYLGFVINNTGIQPTSEFIQSILDFPTPRSITDIRSWFGAVGQITFAFASAPDMLPFRHLLSTKAPFAWSPDLETAFQKSKLEIVRQCEHGVRSFDYNKPTALATDWSKWASGFWLTQKHCQCLQEVTKPGCCNEGWQTVFCGSKFNSPAESNYAPIEGEAMSAAWAMHRCKYFLLGMPSFQLCVDHKPLLAIFGHTQLADIHNPRLFRMKEKTLMFRHRTVHVPGKLNVVPDCLSRRGDSPIPATIPTTPLDISYDISNILPEYQNTLGAPSWVAPPPGGARPAKIASLLGESPAIGSTANQFDSVAALGLLTGDCAASLAGLTADVWHNTALLSPHDSQDTEVITWEKLSKAALESPTYKSLHSLISSGAPEDRDIWPEELKVYYHHRHALVPVGPVLLLHDRPLIPVSLRLKVLGHLHAAHSGVTGMHARAANSVFWPNLRADLTRQRAECTSCVRNAPSNPSSPPEVYIHPKYPFHSICSDFFTVNGVNYLGMVDRYSGWLSLFVLQKDDTKHVVKVLREYFSRWGIPVNLTTDGASVYVSQEMEEFLLRYGVTHRVSSAYYPRGNKRSEVAVKAAKRLVMDNLASSGSLDSDKFARAILCHRNQTDPVSGLSPAEVIFGRRLRDHLPLQPEKFQPRAEWRMEADQREKTFMQRHLLKHEQLSSTSKPLPTLQIGDPVAIQDKSDLSKPGKWTKTGIVTDNLGFQSYEIKVDGSNNLTTRNRSHLRKIIPYINEQMQADQILPLPTPAITRSNSADQTVHSSPVLPEPPQQFTEPPTAHVTQHPQKPITSPVQHHGVQPAGVKHDYAEMARQADAMRRLVMDSKLSTMNTVQAILVTYPVSI